MMLIGAMEVAEAVDKVKSIAMLVYTQSIRLQDWVKVICDEWEVAQTIGLDWRRSLRL